MERSNLPWAALIAAGAAGSIAIGTMFGWVNVLFVSVNGIETQDGKLVLVLAIVSAVLVLASLRSRRLAIVAALGGLGSLGVSAYDMTRIEAFHKDIFGARVAASVGTGLWIDVIGSALLVGAIVQHIRTHRTPVIEG